MKEDLYVVGKYSNSTWEAVTENIDYNSARAALHKFTQNGKVYISPKEDIFFCIFGANNVSFNQKRGDVNRIAS